MLLPPLRVLDNSIIRLYNFNRVQVFIKHKEVILDTKAFIDTVRSAKAGQKASITFKSGRDGILGLRRLNAYRGAGVKVVPKDELVAMAVLSSADWDGDKNRTLGFTGVENLEDDALYEIGRDVERIAFAA